MLRSLDRWSAGRTPSLSPATARDEAEMLLFFASVALGAPLPGLPTIPLETSAEGQVVLGTDLPEMLTEAGVEPGWPLVAVDDLLVEGGLTGVRRAVAQGPSRDIRLRFALPDGSETILVGRRSSLVVVEHVETVPWPSDFALPAAGMVKAPDGQLAVADASGAAWVLEEGSLAKAGEAGDPLALPPLFWELSSASWALVGQEVTWGSREWAQGQLARAARLGAFGGEVGDHLVQPEANGLAVLSVRWPRGTPTLPTCSPRVPETCLASGKQILADLGDRAGAREEARRHLDLACQGGVYRGCYEAEAVDVPALTPQVQRCVESADAAACIEVAGDLEEREEEGLPSDRLLGMLDFACEVEAVGTLGQRLRRLEDVGQGCAMLSAAFDRAKKPDQALLALDRACVLGRADACDSARERRDAAFAARTVRECEDPELPIAPSCIELGRLLQERPVAAATLDDFGAFLRGCALGAAEGCIALGDYVDRWGITNERVMAAEAQLREACDRGELRACMGTAYLLERHEPRSAAYGEALGLFDRACEGRIAEACVAGARQRRIGVARKVEARDQLALWEAACGLNAPEGCAGLGERNARDKVTWAAAFASWTRACDLGDARSCSALGRLVEKRRSEVWEGELPPEQYLSRGCENGDAQGCFWLAKRSLPRKGQPDEQTYLLLEQSCEGNYGDGCAALARVHLDRGTNFDDEIAARHLATACENGAYESCKELGRMYVIGKGVERDRQRANELRQRFQLNASRKHVRIGGQVGLVYGAGGELELVAPIPVGPALAVSGQGSYLPAAGSVLMLLEGAEVTHPPTLTVVGGALRLYPNNKARGLYAAAGFQRLTSMGERPRENRSRSGWNAAIGIRNNARFTYYGVEMGIGQYGFIHFSNWDEESDGVLPLILPTISFSFGLAPL